VVLGAALGAGFGLLEAVARFGMDADQAVPIAGGGWILPNLTPPYIPGIKQVLFTAFPAPVGSLDIADLTKLATGLSPGTSIHLTWTVLAGLGVGWLLRGRGWARLLGFLPLALACGLHALHNYAAVYQESAAESFNTALENVLWLVPLASLATAMALDLNTLHRAKSDVPTASVLRPAVRRDPAGHPTTRRLSQMAMSRTSTGNRRPRSLMYATRSFKMLSTNSGAAQAVRTGPGTALRWMPFATSSGPVVQLKADGTASSCKNRRTGS
jgi:hypothetical protein